MVISGTTKVLGVLGDPVTYSQSPKMYNKAFEILGLDYIYTAFTVKEEGIGDALAGIRGLNMVGCNVTMPLKQGVIPYLDTITPEAKLIGAVNTIVNSGGELQGHNTDGFGMLKGIQEVGGTVEGGTFLLFGTGGASTAIAVEAVAQGAKAVCFVGRQPKAGEFTLDLIQKLGEQYPKTKVVYLCGEEEELVKKAIMESEIIINGTPVGMKPLEKQSPLLWPELLTKEHIVADAVYAPQRTLLLQQAEKAGAKRVGGLAMLLWQGAGAFKLFTGLDMPLLQVKNTLFPEDK